MIKRFLSRFRQPPSAQEIAREVVRFRIKAAELLPTWRDGKPVDPETNFYSLVKNGWRKNELIFACSSRKASTSSQVDMDVVSKRDGKELKGHPLAELLDNPNPRMSQFDFISSISIFHDFAGVAYYEKVRSQSRKVVQLWPMRPDWVKPIASSANFVSGYQYGPPGVTPVTLPAEDVLCIPVWDPINQYAGWPPVAVAARSGDLDNSVTDYMRMIFQEGGVPPGLLKTKQAIDTAIAETMRAEWKEHYGGYSKWMEPAVLGYDLEYQKTGLGIEEMGLEILDERNEVRICMVMRVPPTVISTMVGLKRAIMANAETYETSWWLNDLIPMYKSWGDSLNNQLAKDFGDDVKIQWDFREVPALFSMYEKKNKEAREDFHSSAITRNQYNARVGLPDLGPRGDVYLIPLTMVEVPAGTLKAPVTTEPKSVKMETKEDDPPYEKERVKAERKMTKELTAFFEGELKRIEQGVLSNHPSPPKSVVVEPVETQETGNAEA